MWLLVVGILLIVLPFCLPAFIVGFRSRPGAVFDGLLIFFVIHAPTVEGLHLARLGILLFVPVFFFDMFKCTLQAGVSGLEIMLIVVDDIKCHHDCGQ